jgi:hypothetical protein
VAIAQVIQLFNKVRHIELIELPLVEQPRLLLHSGVKVAIVERISHDLPSINGPQVSV